MIDKNNNIKTIALFKKLSIFILLVILAIMIMIIIKPARDFLLMSFGYSLYLYLLVGFVFGIVWFFGRSFKLGYRKSIIYCALILSLISLIHVFRLNDVISNNSYLVPPHPALSVGGVVISALTYPLYMIYPNYRFMVAVYFIIFALFLLVALLPFIKKIDSYMITKRKQVLTGKKTSNKSKKIGSLPISANNVIVNNPLPSSLNKGENNPTGEVNPEEYQDKYQDANSLLFGDDTHSSNNFSSFGGLLDEGESRSSRSAKLLFSDDAPEKEQQQAGQKYNVLDKNWTGTDIDRFYPNQVRKDIFEKTGNDLLEDKSTYGPYSMDGKYPFDSASQNFRHAEKYAENNVYAPFNLLDPETPEKSKFDDKKALEDLKTPLTYEQTRLFDYVQEGEVLKGTLIQNKLDVNTGTFDNKADRSSNTVVNKEQPYSSQISIDSMGFGREEKQSDDAKAKAAKLIAEKEKSTRLASEIEQTSIFNYDINGENQTFVKSQKYNAPPIELLKSYPGNDIAVPEDYYEFKQKIEMTMEEFDVPAKVIAAKRGPTFTLYELKLGPGYQISKIKSLKENLKMRLEVTQIRILAPIEGRDAFGLEIPNKIRDIVGLKSLINSDEFKKNSKGIKLCFGKTLHGTNFIEDLAQMPHLLVAGATGTGKSVFLNSLIVSILYKYSPEDVRMILIDPKRVELAVYKNLPNLLIAETIKESAQAVSVLNWLTEEMDRRYKFFEQVGCANIDQYNNEIRNPKTEQKMHRIVLIIDEMADLMLKGKGQVESYVVRIAQLARACGIHMIIATQRPTVQVITGLIKANILSRVAFAVKSSIDSRVVLDDMGAEDLLGKGDMIFSSTSGTTRMQGALVELGEIKQICDYIRANNQCLFDNDLVQAITVTASSQDSPLSSSDPKEDKLGEFEDLLKEVMSYFILKDKASISSAQAAFGIGYLKARKIVDALESRGYIGPETSGTQGREILITEAELNDQI